MTRAVLSLGSNLGDRAAALRVAVDGLGAGVRAASAVYRTAPWGGVPQDDFYNIVVIAQDESVDAMGWWSRCQALETAAGRERLVRWGPRTLDVDVITVEDTRGGDPRGGDIPGGAAGRAVLSDDPQLTLPHPRAAERAFVLLPWAEIDPAAILPGAGPISDLLRGLDTTGITRLGNLNEQGSR